MQSIRKILVAVKNPDARRQPAIDKAIHIAKALGASIEFFHAIADPVFLEVQPLTGHSIAELKREALAIRQQRLERLSARARELPGMEADGKLVWTYREAMVPPAIPKSLLVIGSGAIGIEFASFYRTFGAEVTVVEVMDRHQMVPNYKNTADYTKYIGEQVKFESDLLKRLGLAKAE